MSFDANERPCQKCGFQLWFDEGKWYIDLDDYRVREEIRYCPKCGTKLITKVGPSEFKDRDGCTWKRVGPGPIYKGEGTA